jgi:hypothetical protein
MSGHPRPTPLRENAAMDAQPRDPIKNALWDVERRVGRTTLDYEEWLTSRDDLVRLAKPLYVDMLCSLPFYKEREHDDHFWGRYIGSRVNEARAFVARSIGRPYQGVTP